MNQHVHVLLINANALGLLNRLVSRESLKAQDGERGPHILTIYSLTSLILKSDS